MNDYILDIPLTYHKNFNAEWFKHFIVLLFSQGMKEFIIKSSKQWDKTNRFLTIIKNVLKNLYNLKKIREIFDKLNGNLLIMEMIKSFKLNWLLVYFKSNFEPGEKKDFLASNLRFFIEFFKYFNINFIDLSYLDDKYYINLIKNRIYHFRDREIYHNLDLVKPNLSNNKPDIIFVNLDKYNPDLTKAFLKEQLEISVSSRNNYRTHQYNIKFNDNHKKLKIFDEDYILDGFVSLVKNRYNNDVVFSGIRCSNNYYINTSLIDAKNIKRYNFPLLKYDWTSFNDLYISLDQDNKLSIVDEQEWLSQLPNKKYFHFSGFSNTILIYSKVKKERKVGYYNLFSRKQSSSLSSYKSISTKDFSADILKDLYDIEKLSRDELITNINHIDPKFRANSRLTLEKLRQIYLYKLNKQYYSYKLKSLSNDELMKEQEELLKKQKEELLKQQQQQQEELLKKQQQEELLKKELKKQQNLKKFEEIQQKIREEKFYKNKSLNNILFNQNNTLKQRIMNRYKRK